MNEAGGDAAGTASGRGGGSDWMSLSARGEDCRELDCGEGIVCGARSHSLECIALLSSAKPR